MGIKTIRLECGDDLPIRLFSIEDMAENSAIVLVARRGSGKSWVCRKILKRYKHIPVGIIISRTDKLNTFYGNFFADSFVHYEYKTELIHKLLARQDEMIAKMERKAKEGKRIDPRAFILMDDCLSDSKAWAKDKSLYEILYDGRHYKLMYVLTMQSPLGIGPDLRKQFDYIFLFKEEFAVEQKKIWLNYAGVFPTFEAFRQIFLEVTKDFCCMVIVNNDRHKRDIKSTGTWLDKVFWYKADNKDIGEIGCQQFNLYHERNFEKDWKRKE